MNILEHVARMEDCDVYAKYWSEGKMSFTRPKLDGKNNIKICRKE